MKLQLLKVRDALAETFWFVPALMAFVAGTGALATVAVDHALGREWMRDMALLWAGGAEGARSVLSVIAGSIMTVVSIVFSLTVTTLAQTSSHFGPRVLRNFTSDRAVQFTLGTFIATFIYSLLVLRTVNSRDGETFVPVLSVNVGIALAIASLAVLIFFIHRISQSIQAEHLIADVGNSFRAALPVLFPEGLGEEPSAVTAGPPDEDAWQRAFAVEAPHAGYLQRIDDDQLLGIASRHDLLLKLAVRPGDFLVAGAPLLLALPADRRSEQVADDLRACFGLGTTRTPHQDVLYLIQQLVEIAAHALSPGINEPFTALACIDWLGASLCGVAERPVPYPLRRDDDERLRVIAPAMDFGELAHAAFDQVRLYGATNPAVMLHLLEAIGKIAACARRDRDRVALLEQARLIGEDAGRIANPIDRARVADRVRATRIMLGGRGA